MYSALNMYQNKPILRTIFLNLAGGLSLSGKGELA